MIAAAPCLNLIDRIERRALRRGAITREYWENLIDRIESALHLERYL